ncbi:MAG: DPP IV N-terminal domain-containing protein [Myxococcota bacterium]
MKKLFFALALLPALVFAQAPVIEISGANFRPMPLAVAQPLTQDDGAKAKAGEFDTTLLFDLTACGLFQVLDRKSFLSDAKEGVTAGSIQFAHWSNVGAESLVKTQFADDGGQLRGDLRLFTVATGREELKVSHTAPDARRLAHQLANALYKHFTRETGPFESHITYVKKTSAGKDVYVADWDGGNARAVATGGINLLPALQPGAGAIAFTSFRSGKPEVYLQQPGGKPTPLVQTGRMATGVAYSPDGKRIAYSLADGESAQIWVAHADGSKAVQLTKTPFFINSSPSWSPDGTRLAFVSNRRGSPQIYVMSAEGGEPKRLTFQGDYNQTPSWSPRGDLIAFTARDERNAFDLFTVNVETGKIHRLTQDQGNNEEPAFSPNGRLIVFSSNRSGGSRLYVMTFDGNNQVPLPMEKGHYTTPDWGR